MTAASGKAIAVSSGSAGQLDCDRVTLFNAKTPQRVDTWNIQTMPIYQ